MARWPKYQPSENDRRQVLTLSGFGITQADIATVMKCDAKTLRLHYRYELDTGAIEANSRVTQALYTNAVKHNNVAAQIWWTKARMGWRGINELNVGGNGQPLDVHFTWAPASVTDETNTVSTDADTPTIDADADAVTIEWSSDVEPSE